ncbi:MAG: hypothetical protein J6A04_04385 [Clostridia bacterium]|nr:hypothetical protein [Clostridia bacterium]
MPSKDLSFPDITEIIYEESESLSGIRSKYIEVLRKTSLMHNYLYANKLEECAKMLSSANLKELEKEFVDFKEYMRKFCKKKNISLIIKYRQKDFLRLNNKIRTTLSNGYPLDRVRDLLGFRIILTTPNKDSISTIALCYEVLNQVIDFFVTTRHCIPLEAEARTNSKFVQSNHPTVVVPETNLVIPGFESNIKDYVMYPKENGYQSLHVVIQKPNGLTFEVQIRTTAMDILAEKGNAAHVNYRKERKSKTDICLDYSKVQIPGFLYMPDGSIYDTIGLAKSIDPFNSL